MKLPRWLHHRLRSWALNVVASRAPDVEIEAPYLQRWHIIPPNPFVSVYLHLIQRSDPGRGMHDHRSANLSVVLEGGYWEITPYKLPGWRKAFANWWDGKSQSVYNPRAKGDVLFRMGHEPHRLLLEDGQAALTLFITGPTYRTWGFYTPTGFVPWREHQEIVDASTPQNV